jgi:TetR/AcrR family tetracycline transcriptional repressor
MRIVKEHVVTTALALLDEVGIEGVTMRKLAEALKVQAPSLYWHFAGKEELLGGMADALVAPVGLNIAEEMPWDRQLEQIAGEIRAALLARRDGARVFVGTYPLSDNVLRVGSLMIDCLKRAGADDRLAVWGTFAITSYVIGFAIEEQPLADGSVEMSGNLPAELMDRYPHARIAIREIAGGDRNERFAFGLDLQIKSLKLQLGPSDTG